MSNANQMALMIKLANAKNALVSVKTAIQCFEDAEARDVSEYLKSAKFDLRKAECKLEVEVEYLTELFQKLYVKFIPATEQQRAEEEEKNFPRHCSSLDQPEVY